MACVGARHGHSTHTQPSAHCLNSSLIAPPSQQSRTHLTRHTLDCLEFSQQNRDIWVVLALALLPSGWSRCWRSFASKRCIARWRNITIRHERGKCCPSTLPVHRTSYTVVCPVFPCSFLLPTRSVFCRNIHRPSFTGATGVLSFRVLARWLC